MFTPRKCTTQRKAPSQEIGSVISDAQPHEITQRQESGSYDRASVVQFREALIELGWTLDYAAVRCGVSRNSIWNWTNGLTSIPADALILVTREVFGTGSVRVIRKAGGQ